MGDVIEGRFGMTGKEYADGKMPNVCGCGSSPTMLLGGPAVQDYVVLVAMIVDTAVIPATSEREAASKYEMPEMFADKDIAVWAMTRAEFDEMAKEEITDCEQPKA